MRVGNAAGVRLADYALRPVFGQGFVLSIQLPLSLGLDSDPEPDLAIVAGSPRDFVGAHPTSAVLVVEVSESSLKYDRETKGDLYAEAGIQEYWIVTLVDRRLEVYRDPGKEEAGGYVYTSRTMLSASDTVSPTAAPAGRVSVRDLLP